MLIPGFIISWVTFPGVIVHELAHQLFCRLARVAVLEVCYFRFGNPAGYVVHEIPKRTSQQLLIGIGPFFVNTIIGALIALPASIPVIKLDSGSPVDYVLMWLGISIAMHSFPSTGDAKSIWDSVMNRSTPLPLRAVTVPIVGLIYIGAFGSVIWLDAAYGFAITSLIPEALIKLLV